MTAPASADRGRQVAAQAATGLPKAGEVRRHGQGRRHVGVGRLGDPFRPADGAEHRGRQPAAGQITPQADHRQPHPEGFAAGGAATVGPGIQHQIAAGDRLEVGVIAPMVGLESYPGRIDAAALIRPSSPASPVLSG
jgi:hypothetical protein